VLARLIVKLHQSINQTQLIPYWQRGVFLIQGQTRALVVSDEDFKTITIAIDNNDRDGAELLSIIRHTIRSINGNTNQATEQVPLYYLQTLAGFTDYQFLLDAENEGDSNIRLPIDHPKKQSHRFELADLLTNYRLNENPRFDLHQLNKDLITIALHEAETAHSKSDFNEEQINDQFRKALSYKNYHVADQSRGGLSTSGKSAGERDLVIRNRDTGVTESILEGVVLSSCDKAKIDTHYHKLNHRYDPHGNKRNYLLVYARTANFNQLWQKYCQHIEKIEDISEESSDKARLKVGRSTTEFTEVYHIFVDFYVATD
jgi:hypothetical protein